MEGCSTQLACNKYVRSAELMTAQQTSNSRTNITLISVNTSSICNSTKLQL